MIITLAGRRIDEENTETPRFPLANVKKVQEQIEILFSERGVKGLVCSAAAGADLIALETAEKLNIKRRIILTSSHEDFRENSVADRPGEWGKIFDKIYKELSGSRDIVEVKSAAKGDDLYLEANDTILNEALLFAEKIDAENGEGNSGISASDKVLAVIVWEGASRGKDDVTADFMSKAKKMNLEIVQILTK